MKIGHKCFTAFAALLAILLPFGCSKQPPDAASERSESMGSSSSGLVTKIGMSDHDSVAVGSGAEQGYTVSGQAFYRALAVDRQFSFDFKLTATKDHWGIEFTPIPFEGVRYIQNCDGSNLMAITYLKKSNDARAWNDGYVMVDNRRVPVPEPSVAHAVFVAFASQFYLPPGTNGTLCPLWHPEREVNQVAFVNSDWEFMAPGRPEIIRCRYEARKWNEILKKPARNGSGESDPTALMATYSAITKTNFAGGAFPTAYTFIAFAPDREDGQDKASPVYRIEVTNVVLRADVAKELFDRKFKGVAVVEDYRGGRAEPVTYNITNSVPPGLP